MREIWSEKHKRKLWRLIWVVVAEIQAKYDLVKPEQLQELRANQDKVDIPRALEIENEIHHDLMAELRAFAEQCPLGGGVLHLGLTSMDIVDNADVLRMHNSLVHIESRLKKLIAILVERVLNWADYPVMGYTHLQPAEPTTLGYRLASYLQDLDQHLVDLQRIKANLRLKGLKGAVGNRAALRKLLGEEADLEEVEQEFARRLGVDIFPVTTQTYPRLQDWQMTNLLAGIGATLHRFALDLRFLQTPAIGEWQEPFGARQVGSSAMPFKRNPILAEKIDSLSRLLAQYPRLAWDNAAFAMLERTLDDSANRRTLLPEAFLLADELLICGEKLLAEMTCNRVAIERNLLTYASFAAQENLLMALVQRGANRQEMHERLRQHAINAWDRIERGEPDSLAELIAMDESMQRYMPAEQLREIILNPQINTGDAAYLARKLAEEVKKRVGKLEGEGRGFI